jgi:hypothetical protein
MENIYLWFQRTHSEITDVPYNMLRPERGQKISDIIDTEVFQIVVVTP